MSPCGWITPALASGEGTVGRRARSAPAPGACAHPGEGATRFGGGQSPHGHQHARWDAIPRVTRPTQHEMLFLAREVLTEARGDHGCLVRVFLHTISRPSA